MNTIKPIKQRKRERERERARERGRERETERGGLSGARKRGQRDDRMRKRGQRDDGRGREERGMMT